MSKTKKEYTSPIAGNPNFIQPDEDDGFFRQLLNQFYNSNANWERVRKTGLKGVTEDGAQSALEKMFAEQRAYGANPFKTKVDLGGGRVGNGLANTAGAIGANISANPLAAIGMGSLGAANIAGLVDNDKIGGQLVGTLGGGALAHFLPVSPMAKLAVGMGGGMLGSLFDKLRAKKELEQQSMYQQQSY
jgi:hypothetical protein